MRISLGLSVSSAGQCSSLDGIRSGIASTSSRVTAVSSSNDMGSRLSLFLKLFILAEDGRHVPWLCAEIQND